MNNILNEFYSINVVGIIKVTDKVYRIKTKQVPSFLQDKIILEVNPSDIVAGCQYVGMFEDNMTKLMKLCERLDVIVFIDEIHNIIGAGGAEGAIDASNILKPALARGKIKCIGATTTEEYKKHFEIGLEDLTSMLGADVFVFHGAKIPGSIDDEEYCRRFHHLIKMGAEYGVGVCHENVVKHRSESPAYLKMMADYIGEDFKVVFDTKQAFRAGFCYEDFFKDLGYEDVKELGPGEIVEITPDNKTETNYSAVERISIVDNKMIYIHVNNVMAYILPISCFESTEQYNSFMDFIKTKCSDIDVY